MDDDSDAQKKKDVLLSHFIRSLRDEYLYAQHPTADTAVANPDIAQRIEKIFAETGDDWERAYEIQRLLVYLKPSNKLAIDADRRVAEAENLKIPSAVKYRAQLDAIASNLASSRANPAAAAAAVAAAQADADNQRRAILAAAFDDLQWLYQKRNLVRKALHNSAKNIMRFGYLTLVVSASPYLYFLIETQFNTTFFSKFLVMMPNYGLYTAASFGLVGAFFSRLISLQFTSALTVEDAENLFSWRSLMIRGTVGISGAIIFYFLLHSKIIGLAAPDFTKLGFTPTDVQPILGAAKIKVLLPSKDWALLIIWSILAGFSEKLVPDSLAKAEAQATAKK